MPTHTSEKKKDKGLKNKPSDMQLSFCPCSWFKSHTQKKIACLKILPHPLSSCYLTASDNTAVHRAWGPSHTWLLGRHIMVSWKSSSSLATSAHLALCGVLEGAFARRAVCQLQRLVGIGMNPFICKYGDFSDSLNFHRRPAEDTSFHTTFLMLESISQVFLAERQTE